MWKVMESNRPAKYPWCRVHPSWNNNEFKSFNEAIDYAHKWLGAYSPGKKYLRNKKIFWYGRGDEEYVQIVKCGS